MKKISLIFVVVAVLALVIIGACGGNGDEETTAATTTAKTTTPTTEATTAAPTTESSNGGGGGLTWNDMPIYGSADHIEQFTMSFSPDEADYSEFEWRYYETGDDPEDVVDFYQDKMPDNGWEEVWWMDAGDIAYGMYMKNNENDAAVVWIAGEEGETMIGLWRATK